MYVEMRHVNKTFDGFHASRDVSFGIEKGHMAALLGPSGSGKTTLGRNLSRAVDYKHMDIEDYYFPDALIPYSKARTREEVCKLMREDIKRYNNFIISAVNGDFGADINSKYKLAVFLDAPLDIRLKRVKQRA